MDQETHADDGRPPEAPKRSSSKRERAPLSRGWIALLAGSIALAVGLAAGIMASRGSFVPEAALSLVLGVAAYATTRVIERAYDMHLAPRSSRVYGEELREALGGLLDSHLRTAEWEHAVAFLVDRMPVEFRSSIDRGLELGHVIEREYRLRLERLGLVEPICWRERRGIDVPKTLVNCAGVVEAEILVESQGGDMETMAMIRRSLPSGNERAVTFMRRVSPTLPPPPMTTSVMASSVPPPPSEPSELSEAVSEAVPPSSAMPSGVFGVPGLAKRPRAKNVFDFRDGKFRHLSGVS